MVTTWRVRVLDGSGIDRAVHVSGVADAPFAEIVEAFTTEGFATHGVRVEGAPVGADATPSSLGLTHGATIEFGTDQHRVTQRAPGTYLVAVSGPQAGSWWSIPAGRSLLVGRTPPADVQIRDALVSGRHLTLTPVADGAIRLEELGSSNGTKLEGEPFHGQTDIRPGTYLQVGATVLTVLEIAAEELPVEAPVSDGSRPFQRHFRPALEPLPDRMLPPEEPEERETAGSRTWWQYLLPMATGVGFALMTGRWIFLLLMAISPIALVVNHFVRRRRDARAAVERAEGYEADLADYRQQLVEVQVRERERRRRAAVVGGEAVLRAELRHRQLWERVAGDPDHLEVCVGLADQRSHVRTSKDDEERPRLWAVPLSVSLPETGSLLVAGPSERARAVGRSMLLNLATTHAPHEVQVTVITTPDGESDWDWVRWLPHAFIEGGGARVSSTPEHRDAAMTAISQLLDSREDRGPGTPHVVVGGGRRARGGGGRHQRLPRGGGRGGGG
ncbi:MAG: FHA domain-containing protein, partial [Nitriliruptoraceae bacterium]|nr:FHA domain-containing protein [Nitriliruptoraceae bacterium]